MRLLDTLLGLPEKSDLQRAIESVQESATALAEKLDEDPCAADPSRQECEDDVADVLLATRYRRGPRERPV